jgi:hypothetical protein
MALTREARVKPTFGHLYPEVRPGGWESAAAVARRVADRVLTRRGYAALLERRVLSDAHFEFRGGPPEELRPGGHVSRLADRKR